MSFYPIFLSVVLVVRNQAQELLPILNEATQAITPLVSDYELIIVDNASTDESVQELKKLSGENGLPNLQIYALTKEVDADIASWVGLENALGDFVAVAEPLTAEISFLPVMLDHAVKGADVVFAANEQKVPQSIGYRFGFFAFNTLYKWLTGIHLAKEAPQFRVLSKRVVNFILQHPHPAITYRHLPASGGFTKANLSYSAIPKRSRVKHLGDSIDRGMRLIVSTSRLPMRVVTALSLFGAVSNLLYSVYVIAIALLKTNVTPGWVTLSLQQSGMFFLISLVLLVLGEYILQMSSLSNEGPLYHVAQEFTSVIMTKQQKLNIEVVQAIPAVHPNNQVPSNTSANREEYPLNV